MCFSHAGSSQRRIRIKRVGVDAIGHATPITVQEVGGDDLIIVVGCVRESSPAVAFAQRIDAGHIGAELIVDLNITALIDRDAGLFQTEIIRVGRAADGEKQVRADDIFLARAAIEIDNDLIVLIL